jgi:hypothetical protein
LKETSGKVKLEMIAGTETSTDSKKGLRLPVLMCTEVPVTSFLAACSTNNCKPTFTLLLTSTFYPIVVKQRSQAHLTVEVALEFGVSQMENSDDYNRGCFAECLQLEICMEQDRDAVLHAVRGGFSVAFDLLAPNVGLDLKAITGDQVAQLVFPDDDADEDDPMVSLLETKVHVPVGETISQATMPARKLTTTSFGLDASKKEQLSHTLLTSLPGFQDGRFGHLAKGLRYGSNSLQRQKSTLS